MKWLGGRVTWLVASEPRTRPFMARLRDGFLIAVLRSPIGRWIRGMTVITFTGRRSGRTLRTPVECVHEAGQLYVLVARPDTKQWWRNVMANPDVLVEVDGRDVPGHATVHAGWDATAEHDLGVYLQHRPRAASSFGMRATGSREARGEATAGAVSVRIDLAAASGGAS